MKDVTPPAEGKTPQALLSLVEDAKNAGLMAPDVPIEKMRELLAVRQAYEADEARKAFYTALADFQANAPIVEKGDDANGKAYAAMDRIWRTIRPRLGGVGLTVTWQVEEIRESATLGAFCHLEGTLGHRLGHHVPLRANMPIPDAITNSSGRAVQNKAQVFASAITYAKRYATCAALGVVTGEDDDGNGGIKSGLEAPEIDEVKKLVDAWRGTPGWTDEKEEVFWRFAGAPKLASGGHDFGKIEGGRFGDLKWYLERAIKSGSK